MPVLSRIGAVRFNWTISEIHTLMMFSAILDDAGKWAGIIGVLVAIATAHIGLIAFVLRLMFVDWKSFNAVKTDVAILKSMPDPVTEGARRRKFKRILDDR